MRLLWCPLRNCAAPSARVKPKNPLKVVLPTGLWSVLMATNLQYAWYFGAPSKWSVQNVFVCFPPQRIAIAICHTLSLQRTVDAGLGLAVVGCALHPHLLPGPLIALQLLDNAARSISGPFWGLDALQGRLRTVQTASKTPSKAAGAVSLHAPTMVPCTVFLLPRSRLVGLVLAHSRQTKCNSRWDISPQTYTQPNKLLEAIPASRMPTTRRKWMPLAPNVPREDTHEGRSAHRPPGQVIHLRSRDVALDDRTAEFLSFLGLKGTMTAGLSGLCFQEDGLSSPAYFHRYVPCRGRCRRSSAVCPMARR